MIQKALNAVDQEYVVRLRRELDAMVCKVPCWG